MTSTSSSRIHPSLTERQGPPSVPSSSISEKTIPQTAPGSSFANPGQYSHNPVFTQQFIPQLQTPGQTNPTFQVDIGIIHDPSAPPPVYIKSERTKNKINKDETIGAIVLSCFVFWFCGILFGLVAFVLSVYAFKQVHDRKFAHKLTVVSYIISMVGVFVALAVVIIVAVVFTKTNNTSGGCSDTKTTITVNGVCYSKRISWYGSSSCADAGGFYDTSSYIEDFCYFEESNYNNYLSCSGYWIPTRKTCYSQRTMSASPSSCSAIDGYYGSTPSAYCYYSVNCATWIGSQCYRYSASVGSSVCTSTYHGTYYYGYCYYN